MRLSLLLLPLAQAAVAPDVFNWAADLLSGAPQAPAIADQPVYAYDGWKWSDCGLPSDAITVDEITVTPDPPEPGKNLTVHVVATANEVIEEGAYADVTVKLGLVKLLQKRFDVCEEARNNNASIQCPVQPGDYIVDQTVELPKEIPKAKFVINVRGYTADDDDMVCLDLVVDFMKKDARAA